MEVRLLRRPESEVGDADDGATVAEGGRDFVAAVEEERRVEVGFREVDGLDFHFARGDAACPHEELPVVEDEPDAVVEAAVEVEVVILPREFVRRPVEAVV